MPRVLFRIWVVGCVLFGIPWFFYTLLMTSHAGLKGLVITLLIYAGLCTLGFIALRVIGWVFEPEGP